MNAKAQIAPIVCRLIVDADLAALPDLLLAGFPDRTLGYWERALARLGTRDAPDGYPRYGYLLEADADIVGVILLIFSSAAVDGPACVRCNVSSWYVRPGYSSYGALLISRALRFKEVTYLNISPAPHTWPILEAQGYRRYSEGLFVCAPALTRRSSAVRVRRHTLKSAGSLDDLGLRALLAEPMRQDLVILSAHETGDVAPFVFAPTKIKSIRHGVLQLAYCRDTSDFIRHAGPIGRALLASGHLLVTLDGHSAAPGLLGWWFRDRTPKYFKGPRAPRLNDLGCTEALLFGR